MKIHMDLHSQLALVLSLVVLARANEYQNRLSKLWSLSRSDGARTAVLNVTSASVIIEPTTSSAQSDRIPRKVAPHNHPYEYKRYAFKPRAIPIKRSEPEERSIHYTNGEKSDILLPGNYFPIADVKRENLSDETTFNPLAGGPFQPTIIPLLRSQEFQRRSLDTDEEPIIEKPDGFTEAVAQRRSWSLLGVEGDERDEDGDDDEFEDEDEDEAIESKHHKKKPKVKKLTKYMLPLLIAYKLKFFSMIPLMIGGLVLLVGATGMAGFFFALFAAVMGLQKGSY